MRREQAAQRAACLRFHPTNPTDSLYLPRSAAKMARMQVGLRKVMMSVLVAAFAVQTTLVYCDDTADGLPVHDAAAQEGFQIWHRNNCQACHQIYGFGGFLGPDLTNVMARVDRARLDQILTAGSAQMPAFHMNRGQIDAVEAFLRVVNESGIGQARRGGTPQPAMILQAIDAEVRTSEPPSAPAVVTGWEVFQSTCRACHTPLQATPMGLFVAADLATVTRRLSDTQIQETVRQGRPLRGMPAQSLSDDKLAGVLAFLHWLGEREPDLRERLYKSGNGDGWPWFEFK